MKTAPLPGIPARYPSTCPRCEAAIQPNDRIYFRRGEPVHVGCQSGGRDE